MKESSYPLLPWLRQIVHQNCFSVQFIDSSRCGQEKMELNEENKRNLVCVCGVQGVGHLLLHLKFVYLNQIPF